MRDERGVTSPMSYTLTVAISAILVTGLVLAGTGHVTEERRTTARAQMDVVGQQVAANLESADRLVDADAGDDPSTLTLRRDLPDQILGSDYQVEVQPSENRVVVTSTLTDRAVRVPYHVETVVVGGSLEGGAFVVSYDVSDDELVVNDG